MPGTSTILHTLINTESTPPGIRVYRKRQLEHAIQRPFEPIEPSSPPPHPTLINKIRSWVKNMLLCGFMLAAVAGCMWVAIVGPLIFTFRPEILMGVAYGAGLLLIGIGGGLIANGIHRQIARVQHARAWDLLLILPYERHEIVLGWAAQGFMPIAAQIGFLFMELIGIMLIIKQLALLRLLALSVLLVIEWVQLIALSVTVGLLSASRRQSESGGLNFGTPLAYGLLLAIGRTAGGTVMALLAGWQGLRFSLASVVGPMNGVVARDMRAIPLLLGLLYLLVLEGLIRVLFARGVSRLGES